MQKNVEVWDHFDKINKYKALCKHCRNKYIHNGLTHNLLQHLLTKHIDKLGICDKYSKLSCNVLWEYFTKIGEDKMAICNICDKVLSYKTTVTNLKVHLSRSHSESFLRMLQNLPPVERIDKITDSADAINDEDSNESDQLSPDIWSHFEQETGGRARCVLCRTTRPNNVEDLKNHLAEKHPKLLNGASQDATVSDESGNEDGGNYTEVIYVEENTKGKPSKYYVKEPTHSNRKTNHRPKKPERARRPSTSSEDLPIKRWKTEQSEPDQLDSFLTYIKCLLRQVPNDVCAKLQLDIVNLIMKAKFKEASEVPENSMTVLKEVNIDRADVISVALADADIAPLNDTEQCYVEEKNVQLDCKGTSRL